MDYKGQVTETTTTSVERPPVSSAGWVSARGTLRPPDFAGQAPKSAATAGLERVPWAEPIERYQEGTAELAPLRAALSRARAQGDPESERRAAADLANALAERGTELDTAIECAERSLELGEDPNLRERLSTWLSGLGESPRAARTLSPLTALRDAAEKSKSLTKMAVWFARANDATNAARALAEAMRAEQTDPLPAELFGALSAWAPSAVPKQRAAVAYLEAFRRRNERREKAAGFEDLIRAFETDPTSSHAAGALSRVLEGRRRSGAADEVLREHARFLGTEGRSVHCRRFGAALGAADKLRALGAALDARFEASLGAALHLDSDEGPALPETRFAPLLEQLGLSELSAAWFQVAADLEQGSERANGYAALGRLCAGPLRNPERAVDAWIDALAANVDCEEAFHRLRKHADEDHDYWPLADGLIRAAGAEGQSETARQRALETVVELAEYRLSDAGLALWAHHEMPVQAPDFASNRERLEQKSREQTEKLAQLQAELALGGDPRPQVLRRLAALLRGRPAEASRYADVLRQLSILLPGERRWQQRLLRVLSRPGFEQQLLSYLTERLNDVVTLSEKETLSSWLCTHYVRQQEPEAALRLLLPHVSVATPRLSALSLVLAGVVGDVAARAQALVALAYAQGPALRALMLSVAAETYLEAGQAEEARALADRACQSDPSLARALSARARVALSDSPIDTETLERAMGVIVPRANMCEALADDFEARGEPLLALLWTQRQLALLPGNLSVAKAFLERVTVVSDPVRIHDALVWVLSQPQPVSQLKQAIIAALGRLGELDPKRASGVARRVLDVLGPRDRDVRGSLLALAESVAEPGLGVAVLERWLSVDDPEVDRGELLFELSRRQKLALDADGAARSLSRAAAYGVSPRRLLAELASALPPATGDGELSLLEACVEARCSQATIDVEPTVSQLRKLGAARFDLAADPDGAVEAWLRAAELEPELHGGVLASDLFAFGGIERAIEGLERFARSQADVAEQASVLGLAAHFAHEKGERELAFSVAAHALSLDPSRTDVLAVAEQAAHKEDTKALEDLYERASQAALGCYAERALHYRAARQLERRDETALALTHAIKAFEAVPGAGVTFVLMSRLGQRADQTPVVVAAIEGVAAACRDREARAEWLRRASLLVDDSEAGVRQQVDVLLRALAVAPEVPTLRSLSGALKRLFELVPEDRDVMKLRFDRAAQRLFAHVAGPEGARVCIVLVETFLERFDDVDQALVALECAFALSDVEEFGELLQFVPKLAVERARIGGLAQQVLDTASERPGFADAPLELAQALSGAAELDDVSCRLLVLRAERSPDDEALLGQAQQRVRRSGKLELLDRLLGLGPPSERVQALLQAAGQAEAEGDLTAAVSAVERALGVEGIGEGPRLRAVAKLSDLLHQSGREQELERFLRSELKRADLPEEMRVRLALRLSSSLREKGRSGGALKVLRNAAESTPRAPLFSAIADLHSETGQKDQQAEALRQLAKLTEGQEQLGALRRLARLFEELGQTARALSSWGMVLKRAPGDRDALRALESDAERRGDYERLVELLAQRAAQSDKVTEVRALRLRRAVILDQCLGRPEDARSELMSLMVATGENLRVLRVAADLDERLGGYETAAGFWMRASRVCVDPEETRALCVRGIEAYLRAGDLEMARGVLAELEPLKAYELLALRVEVERRSENTVQLALALERLAADRKTTPEERAAYLLEAAQASRAAGDNTSALQRARRSAESDPQNVAAQLFARQLEYTSRGHGTVAQAEQTLKQLSPLKDSVDASDLELWGFLVAEAKDVVEGADAGQPLLEELVERVGQRPLLALGMAERLARDKRWLEALSFYDRALGGDLQQLRRQSDVALAAARAAQALGDLRRAESYLETAVPQGEARRTVIELGREIRQAMERSEQAEAPQEEAVENEPDLFDEWGEIEPEPIEPEITHADSAPPGGDTLPVPLVQAIPSRGYEFSGVWQLPTANQVQIVEDSETQLLKELSRGSLEAGEQLLNRLEQVPGRDLDVLSVAWRMFKLSPGNHRLISRLHQAAVADRNLAYAHSLEHLMAAFSSDRAPVAAPALEQQAEQPDAIFAMLKRGLDTPAVEAAGLVWQSAPHLFRRDPGTYGVTGLERVPLTAPTPVARVYSNVARAFGMTRTALFQRQTSGPIQVQVALLAPPALIVAGDGFEESSTLYYRLGAAMAAARPQYAILCGGEPAQVEEMLQALLLAFGPPQRGVRQPTPVANLAEALWEGIPASAQRRLGELCEDPSALDYELVMSKARMALRRAGLYACGDAYEAVSECCRQEQLGPVPGDLVELERLCTKSLSLSDLVRLAASPEYAMTRFQQVKDRAAGSEPPA